MLDRINPGDMAGVDPGGSNARLQEAERSLARSKRDLAEAVGNARRLEQRVAEARRRLEQWRWINAGTGDPELAREAAIRVTMQTTAIETEEKFASDVAARITRLQSRVERQATRVFDLQTRRRDENVDAAHDPADENEARAGMPDHARDGEPESTHAEHSDATLWPRLWRPWRGTENKSGEGRV